MWLTSWQEKGLAWGFSDELTGLQTCVHNMINKRIKLVNVIQVMLIRRILPCQRRTCNLWEFDPAKHQTLLELFGTKHEDIWKVLFKAGEVPPPMIEGRGLSTKRRANPVSSFMFARYSFYRRICGRNLSLHATLSGLGNDSTSD